MKNPSFPVGFSDPVWMHDRWMVVGLVEGKTVVRWYKGSTFVESPKLGLKDWAKALEKFLETDVVANARTVSHLSLKNDVRQTLTRDLPRSERAIFGEKRRIVIGPLQFKRVDEGSDSELCWLRSADGKSGVSEVPLELMAEFSAWILSDPVLELLKQSPDIRGLYRSWLKRRKPDCFDAKGFLVPGREKDFVTDLAVLTQQAVLVSEITSEGEVVVAVPEKPKVVKPKAVENPAGVLRWLLQQTSDLASKHPEVVPSGFMMLKDMIFSTSLDVLVSQGVEECQPGVIIDTAKAVAEMNELRHRLQQEAVLKFAEMKADLQSTETSLNEREAALRKTQAELAEEQSNLARERAEYEGEKLRMKKEMEQMKMILQATQTNLAASAAAKSKATA